MTDTQVYAGIVAVGALAGIRSMSAPALVAEIVPATFIPVNPGILKALALGEFVADKLPFMPNRTSPLPLLARGVAGGLCGAAISSHQRRSVAFGAALGALAAVGMTFVAFKFRSQLSESLPGPLVGLIEDAFVTGTGALMISRFSPPAITA